MNMRIPLKCGAAGRYKLTVRNADLSIKHETDWFDNLITDFGLNFMGDNGGYLFRCHVGSGTATPVASDTTLGSFVASTQNQITSVANAQSTAPYYGSRTNTYRFAEGDAAGNISEVGIGSDTGGVDLFSRALVTDGSGNSTTVTVLSDEVLDVTYELRVIPPTTDVVTTVVDSGPAGTSHTVTVRAAQVTDDVWAPASSNGTRVEYRNQSVTIPEVFDGALGAITVKPSGTSEGINGAMSNAAYSNNSLQRDGSFNLAPDEGNLASGIAAVRFATFGAGDWQIGFDPAIAKTSEDTLKLDLRVSWSRATI